MNRLLITVLIVVLVLVGLVLFLNGDNSSVVVPNVGALAGPDIPSPYLRWGGTTIYNSAQAMTATSSVACSFQNPSSATTTLENFTAQVTSNGIAVAQTFDVATSTSNHGTSTPSLAHAVSAGTGQWSFSWTPRHASSSNPGGTLNTLFWGDSYDSSPFLVGPNEYVNLKIATSTPGSFTNYWTGGCTATFRVLQ